MRTVPTAKFDASVWRVNGLEKTGNDIKLLPPPFWIYSVQMDLVISL